MFTRRVLLTTLVALSLAVPAFAEEGVELEPGLTLLAPISVAPLSIFPVVAKKKEAPKGDYLTLAQGLKEKLVVVAELGSAEVNQVNVSNKSDKALLLLGGEIILGGQQDRVISSDTIVEPRHAQKVTVFCVEHGRWSGAGQFTQAGGFAEGKLRRVAKYDKAQGSVWQQVATKTGALKAESSTGTYRTLATGAEGRKAIERFASVKQALAALPQAGEVVGLVSAVNGVVRSVDIFATPALFQAYRDGLLDSAIVDAADAAVEKDKVAPKAADVKAFIDEAEKAKPEEVESTPASHTVQKKGAGVSNSTLSTQKPAPPVYRSYQNSKY